MKTIADPDWIDLYVHNGDLPASRLCQAVLCGELAVAIGMSECKGTEHLSSLVAMIARKVPKDLKGDAKKVARWIKSNGVAIPNGSMLQMLLRQQFTAELEKED